MESAWWQPVCTYLLSGVMVLVSVIVGAYCVFKTKTITMPTPFIGGVKSQTGGKPSMYAADLFGEDAGQSSVVTDHTLSSAAARLRAEKEDPDMKIVRGGKK